MPVVLVELAPVILGLLSILFAIAATWAIKTIGQAIGVLGAKLPIIGTVGIDIGSFFVSKADDVLNWAVDQGKQYFQGVANWFIGHEWIIRELFYNTIAAISHLGDQIAHIVGTDIPNAITKAERYAIDHAGASLSTVEADLKKAESAASTALSAAQRSIVHELAAAEQSITADVHSAVRYAEDHAAAFTNTVKQELTTYVDTEVAAAEHAASVATSNAQILTGVALAGVRDIADQALGDVAAVYGAGVAIPGELANALGDVYTDLTGKAAAVAGDLSGAESLLAGAIAGMVAASLASVVARVAELEKCAVTNCADDTGAANSFSNLLQAALGVASLVGVGAFLEQAIDDPAGAEQQYAGVVQGLFAGGSAAAGSTGVQTIVNAFAPAVSGPLDALLSL